MSSRAAQGWTAFGRIVLAALAVSTTLSCSTDTPLGSPPGGFAFSLLPVGTTESRLASGLAAPTAMALVPDGRVLVSEQCGQLRIVKNGVLLSGAALTLPVDCTGERGLLGVATDPAFGSNNFLYLYYTTPVAPVHNRVSRFTLTGDLVSPGSERVLLELDDLSEADNHNGGALHFAADGTLFIASGDNNNSANSQSLTSLFGKILRINTDGSIPADNPFYGSTSGSDRTIWARGFRNPFTFAFQPGTGRMFINDVGEQSTEEVDDGIAGSNYGWPTCEGPCSPATPGLRDPIYWYTHNSGGCAITGGTFYSPSSTRFPSSYLGKYMFADFCGGDITVLDPATRTATGFSTGLSAPVDLTVSPDGGLLYLQRGEGSNTGELWRVDGTTNQAPIITLQPTNLLVSVGQPARLSLTATGTAPLGYQWQRNGTAIPGETNPEYTLASTTMADSGGFFRCVVTNDFGSVTSAVAVLSVTTNQLPIATILPPAGTTYRAGQTINYSATASDPETGPLPASAYSWQVVFHHDTHTHPFIAPTSGASGGSLVIPTMGETSANVYYAILLTVTDPAGLSQTFERDLIPETSTLTLQTAPAGGSITLDGQPVVTPASVVGVIGIQRTLGVVSPQFIGGTQYFFSAWSDGGGASHPISTPASNTSYTATYLSAPPPPPNVSFVQANANTVVSGASLTVSLSAATMAGNLLVVGVDWGSATFGTISDAQGNTFIPVVAQQTTPGGVKSRFYYAPNIRGGSEAVTVTLSGSDPSLQVYLAEYRGADVNNPLDVTIQSTGPAGSVSSGTVATSSNNDQIVGFCVSDGTCTVASGFAARSTHSNNLLEDQSLATAGPVAATATSNNGWSMVLAAFRPQQGPVAPVATVEVSPPAASVQAGQTIQLAATPKDVSGNPLGGRTIVWTSDAPALATVSNTGLVTGITAGGPVAIRASAEGETGSALVTVTPPPPPTPVTASVTAANKVFDGSTAATITGCTLSGSPAGVSCTAPTASFSDPAIGNGKTVTATGITLSGANAVGYVLTSSTATTTANITATPPPSTNVVFVQANANTGVNTASLTVPLTATTGANNLLVVGIDWGTATFATISDAQGNSFTQVGSQQSTPGGVKSRFYYARNIRGGSDAVTVTLSGNDPSLQVYLAEYRGADITNPLDVTVQRTGSAGSVTSGTAGTTTPNDQIVGFCVGDGSCTVGSGFSARSTHSNNLLEDRSVAAAGSTAATASANNGWSMVMAAFRPQQAPPIPVASVTISPASSSVQTGQTVQLTATPRDASGTPLSGRAVSWSSDTPSLATVNASGLVSGVAAGGPVTIRAISEGQTGTASVSITPPPPPTPVTPSVTAANKAFDGTTAATITSCTLSGSPAGVSCSAASASFDDPAIGNGKTVTAIGITLGGVSAANYVLTTTTATTTANIIGKTPVTASVTAANKVFNGNTSATITSCTLSGSPAGVTCSAASASFSDPAVGDNKTVTAIGITLGGPNAGNYVLTSTTATTTASIIAQTPVTASVTAANKVFDGSSTATITSCTLSGSPAGVTCSAGAANFSDPAVGNGKPVTATGIVLGGANAANYVLTSTSATTTASITAAVGSVSFIQANARSSTGRTNAVPLSSSTVAGDLLVVGIDWAGNASFTSVTDNQGNSYTLIGSQISSPGGMKTRLYYARNVTGGSATVTVTLSGNSSSLQVYVAHYRGAHLTNPLDVTAQRSGSSGSVTSGNVTTTSANDRVVGFCVSDGTCTFGSGFTARSTHSNNLLEDKVQATAGSVAATATSNKGWVMILAAFRPQ